MRTAGLAVEAGAGWGEVGLAVGTFTRTAGGDSGGGGAVVTGASMEIRGRAGADAGVGTDFATVGGGAISVAGAVQVGGGAGGVGETDRATGPVISPNCCRTASLMRPDKSAPQPGQANVTGLRTISGEASNAYLAPQSQ